MSDNRSLLHDSIRALANIVEDDRRLIKKTEDLSVRQEVRMDKLEAELERQLTVQEKAAKDIQRIKNELDSIKDLLHDFEKAAAGHDTTPAGSRNTSASNPQEKAVSGQAEPTGSSPGAAAAGSVPEPSAALQPVKEQMPVKSLPVMQGNGFSHITYDYLKKLGDKP